jgi:hypothetical protein
MALKGKCDCYDKAAPDEPIFVLRAQDILAPTTILEWAYLALQHGTPLEKVTEAMECAKSMREWQESHTSKTPD